MEYQAPAASLVANRSATLSHTTVHTTRLKMSFQLHFSKKPLPTMLCDICQKIEFDELDQEPDEGGYSGSPHHLSFAALFSCEACEFCMMVVNAISVDKELQTGAAQEWRQHPIYLRIFPSETADESDKSNLLVYCTPDNPNTSNQRTLAIFGLCIDRTEEEWKSGTADKTRSVAKLIEGRPVSAASDSPECFRLANLWLERCVKNHKESESAPAAQNSVEAAALRLSGLVVSAVQDEPEWQKVERFIPTRTIDVGPADGSCEPRLVDHSEVQTKGHLVWATLSHCWGGSSPLKTTISVLEGHKREIALDQMPQTFYDAVIVTRKMGIRHLWVDSLCIIQDSEDDWAKEAASMGDIYKYGVVNIAASSGRGCHDGIFATREKSLSPVQLPLRSKKHNVSGFMYVRAGQWNNYWPKIIGEESTLSSRGWVLQESVLSPRTLHYSKDQMFWECQHFTFAESCAEPVVKVHEGYKLSVYRWISNKMALPTGMLENSPRHSNVENDATMRADMYQCWLQLVKNYTSRQLTFQSDMFPALGSIASMFQRRLGDKYLAGLFEGDLLVSLLWKTVDPNSAQKRPGFSTPSWSWASIRGPVIPEIAANSNMVAPQLVGDCTARIIEAKTLRSDGFEAAADHFLEVKSGSIVIEGQLLLQSDDLSNMCYIRKDAESFPERSTTIPNFQASKYGEIVLDCGRVLNIGPTERIAILHLGIWEWWWRGSNRWFNRRFAGLLLKAVDDTGTKYERLGMVTMSVIFHNVNVDSMFEREDEDFLRTGWERRTITIV